MNIRKVGLGAVAVVALLAASYSAAWFKVAASTKANLQTMLQAKSSTDASNLAVSYEGFPGKMTFRVVGFSQAFAHPKTGQKTLVVASKPLVFSTYLWQPHKIEGDLSNSSFILKTNSQQGTPPTLARLTVEEGKVDYNFAKSSLKTTLSRMAYAPEVGQQSQIENLVFKQEIFKNKAGLLEGKISIALKNLQKIYQEEAFPVLEIFLMEGGVENFPQFVPYHGGDGADAAQKILTARVRDLAANNSRFFVSNFLMAKGGLQIAASGESRLDDQLRPEGSLTVKVNNLSAALKEIMSGPQTDSPFLELLQNVAGKNEASFVLSAQAGQLKLNSFPIGGVPPLPEILLQMAKQQQASKN